MADIEPEQKSSFSDPAMEIKFANLFQSIESQMVKQTSILTNLFNLELDRRADEERDRKLKDLSETEQRQRRKRDDDLSQLNNPPTNPNAQPHDDPSTFGTAMAAFLGAGSGRFMGMWDQLVKAGFLAVLARPLSNFLGGAITQVLENAGVKEALANKLGDGIADGLGDAGISLAIGTVVGSILGKRMKILTATGSFLYLQLNKYLDPDNDGIVKAFGQEFDANAIAGIGAAIGSVVVAFLPGILTKGLAGIFTRVAIPAGIGLASGAGALVSGTGKALKAGGAKVLNFGSKAVPALKQGAATALESGEATLGRFAGAASKAAKVAPIVGAAIQFFTPDRADAPTTGDTAHDAFGRIFQYTVNDPTKTVDEKINKAIEESKASILPYTDKFNLMDKSGQVIPITKDDLLNKDFWRELITESKSSNRGDNYNTPNNMTVPGISFTPEGQYKMQSIAPENLWRFNEKSTPNTKPRYDSLSVGIPASSTTSTSQKTLVEGNKSSTSIRQGDTINSSTTNIFQPPSYSLRQYLPQ